MKNKGLVLLLSGGLDSCAAYSLLSDHYDIYPLFIDYGQLSIKNEKKAAEKISSFFGDNLIIITLDWYFKLVSDSPLLNSNSKLPNNINLDDSNQTKLSAKKVWLPNRNGLFLNIAACYAEKLGFSNISSGFNIEEAQTFPDNSEKFIESLNKCFSLSTMNNVKIISPTSSLNKQEIAEIICNKGLEQIFFSCYSNDDLFCGKCESCQRTIRAFKNIGKLKLIKERFNEITYT